MIDKDPYEIGLEKARAFFNRAEEVASTQNFDYAIDLYLEGLHLSPDALEDGHAPLRRLALIRQGKGGKKPSMMEKVKHLKSKTPLDEMLNAEFLMAKDPDHLPYAEDMLKAAVKGGIYGLLNGWRHWSLRPTKPVLVLVFRPISSSRTRMSKCRCLQMRLELVNTPLN